MAKWYEEGVNPDYRFTLANERTFLAWMRTGLGFFISAISIDQLLIYMETESLLWGFPYCLLAISTLCIVSGYIRWKQNEKQMRNNAPLHYGIASLLLTLIAIGTVIAFVLYKLW
ncbi:YidH family protein [Marinomonas epiphytica]